MLGFVLFLLILSAICFIVVVILFRFFERRWPLWLYPKKTLLRKKLDEEGFHIKIKRVRLDDEYCIFRYLYYGFKLINEHKVCTWRSVVIHDQPYDVVARITNESIAVCHIIINHYKNEKLILKNWKKYDFIGELSGPQQYNSCQGQATSAKVSKI
jgi:hypothetical protein